MESLSIADDPNGVRNGSCPAKLIADNLDVLHSIITYLARK